VKQVQVLPLAEIMENQGARQTQKKIKTKTGIRVSLTQAQYRKLVDMIEKTEMKKRQIIPKENINTKEMEKQKQKLQSGELTQQEWEEITDKQKTFRKRIHLDGNDEFFFFFFLY